MYVGRKKKAATSFACLFYSNSKQVGWFPLTLRRENHFSESTDSNANFIWNTITDTQKPGLIWAPVGTLKLTHKMSRNQPVCTDEPSTAGAPSWASLCFVYLDLSCSLCSGSVWSFVPHRPFDACILFRLCPPMSSLSTLGWSRTGRRNSASVGVEVGIWRAGPTGVGKALSVGHFSLCVLIWAVDWN